MKTKNGIIKISLVLLMAVLILIPSLLFAIGKFNHQLVYADATIEQFEIADEIGVGEVLKVPNNVVLRIDENTTVSPTKRTLTYPNGVVRTLESQVLTEKGKYVVEFYGKNGNVVVKAEKTFYVKDDLYVLSEALFDKAEFKTADTIKYGELMGEDGEKRSAGIEVTVGQNEYFRYNKPVNLYNLPVDSNGRTDIVNFYPRLGYYDELGKWQVISRLATVKLIDCYDETNYVEFYLCDRLLFKESIYFCAGASYQTLTGMFETKDGEAHYEGKTYRVFNIPRYGYDSYGAYAGLLGCDVYKNGGFNLQYNLKEQKIFMNNVLVSDLDSEAIYPDNTFKGFTTGEVYIQFEFPRQSQSLDFQITSLFGLEGEELKNGFVTDDTAPLVKIDLEMGDKDYINVTTGKEFVFPEAQVFDVYGVKELKKAVYVDYFTDQPKIVYSDGEKFTPVKNSAYTIVYMATDNSGNKNVDANGKCLNYINISSIEEDIISYDKENKITSLSASSVNNIPYLSATSSNGDVTVSVFAVNSKGDVEDITNTYNGFNYVFTPEFIGKYEIKYVFNDGIFVEEFAYEVTASDVGAVLFKDKLQLPSVLIKNAIYDIAPYYSYLASENGLVPKKCEIWVRNDGAGDFVKIEDVSKFEVKASSFAEFKLKCDDVWSDIIAKCQIVDVNINEEGERGKTYQNYFYGYDSALLQPTSIDYTLNAGVNKKLTYATPIARSVFALEFAVKGSGINEFSIRIEEISTRDNLGYEVTYKYFSGTQYFYKVTSLDGNTVYLDKLVSGDYYATHLLQITNGSISCELGYPVKLWKTEAKYIEFSINCDTVTEPSQVSVSKVCNTSFSEYVYELPLQLCFTRPVGTFAIGMKYTLPEFYVSSVFYPVSMSNLTYTLSSKTSGVKNDENGKPLKDVNCGDGKTYSFDCDKAEKYEFIFKYDNNGKYLDVRNNYAIVVADNVPPVIQFTDGSNSETVVKVAVGEKVMIKEYTITDNVSSDKELTKTVFVTKDNGILLTWKITENQGYVFDTAGRYRYCVYAVDAAGNSSMAYYVVEVA